ncbi:helix-turn-helix domain-containing protein [Kribbella catacumbae]|uniref:helix-turn-helix domain-containing protein n=1 Tax=Kribbella catacumbae TaxID=460086 RepID=UPI0003678BCC|nr:helix-turn-helix domain-containing protein [Kribbella catacumbae]
MSLSVERAARLLQVSPQEVRRLIAAGELAAERLGERSWSLDEASVRLRAARGAGRGRPWIPAKAWAALWRLSGLPVDWLSTGEMWRLRAQLDEISADGLVIATRRRAGVEAGRVLPEYLERLVETDGVVRTGMSAAAAAGADLIGTGQIDLYCGASLRSDLVARYGIDLTSSNPNVVLRVPEGDLPLLEGREVMPAAVVAADLLGSTEPRAVRAGRDLLGGLLTASR